jgi:hypothetical protein
MDPLLSSVAAPRGCGGIGRRARFRSVWGKPRGGSSPLIRIFAKPPQTRGFFTGSNGFARRDGGATGGPIGAQFCETTTPRSAQHWNRHIADADRPRTVGSPRWSLLRTDAVAGSVHTVRGSRRAATRRSTSRPRPGGDETARMRDPAKAQLATRTRPALRFRGCCIRRWRVPWLPVHTQGDRPVAAHGYPHAIAARDGRARRRLVQLRDLGLAAHGTRPARSATPASARRRSPPAPCPARRPVPTRRGNRRQLTGDAVHARRAPMVRVSTSLRP